MNNNLNESFKDNLFVEAIFLNAWITYYGKQRKLEVFEGIEPLKFVTLKSSSEIYINAGANKTYGLSYNISSDKFDNSNKIILIKDVHNFFKRKDILKGNVGRKTLKRYPGFLVDFKNYESAEQYLKSRFSKNRIRKLKTCKRRLELCYEIEYKFYKNKITREEHEFIFSNFKKLLVKRYKEKKIKNIFLEENFWSFQKELYYKLINAGKASIFVIYANNMPINVCLNYFTKESVILGMIAFDTDFERFNVGHLSLNRQLDYYYKSGYSLIDFSQSAYDYKKKICNVKYEFEYHILYNTKSVKHVILSMFIWWFYIAVTLKYKLKKRYLAYINKMKRQFQFGKSNKKYFRFFNINELLVIKFSELEPLSLEIIPEELKKPINYFLYKYTAKSKNLKVFKFLNKPNTYIFIVEKYKEKVTIYK